MKELSFSTFLAVFEEMFGRELFWGLVAAALLVTLVFVVMVVRERRLESRRFLRAELTAPLGAVLAMAFVFWFTNSGPANIGGPIDWVILAAIAVAGGGGLVMASYVLMGLMRRRRRARAMPAADQRPGPGAARPLANFKKAA
ncbi:MAG: DUF5368 domain-containing protein [Geminicoccaceae bacterium]|nr:DUF5368 domain-containing protein [Geminicoccaceae bacterium]